MYPLCICSPVSRTAPRFFFSFFFFLFSFVVYGGAKEGHPGCCVITRANQPTNQPTGPSRYSIYTLGGMPRQETLRPIAVRRSNGHQWRRGYSADVCGCSCHRRGGQQPHGIYSRYLHMYHPSIPVSVRARRERRFIRTHSAASFHPLFFSFLLFSFIRRTYPKKWCLTIIILRIISA